MHFDKRTEVAGYSKVRIWMSCDEHNDMDVYVQIRKLSSTGELLEHLNYPVPAAAEEVPDVNVAKYLGPQGVLRASHLVSRNTDRSTDMEIFYDHDRTEYVKTGTIVPMEITLWPIGMVFEQGEGIMLRVAGHDLTLPEVELVKRVEPEDENVGFHKIHTGGQYDSCLIIPTI
jgi:uncharacterized protein